MSTNDEAATKAEGRRQARVFCERLSATHRAIDAEEARLLREFPFLSEPTEMHRTYAAPSGTLLVPFPFPAPAPAAAAAAEEQDGTARAHPLFRAAGAGWAEAGGEAVRRQVIGAAHGDLAALRVLRRVGGRGLHIEMVFAADGEYRHFTDMRRAKESAMLHGDLAANGGEGDRQSDA